MTSSASLYGQSLYDLAVEEDLTEDITRQMSAVLGIFRENPDYITLLSEPSIPRRERIRLVDDAFGEQVQPYLVNFIKVLLEQDMLREFPGCEQKVRECYNRDHGITEAIVTSAVALSEEQRAGLEEQLVRISGGPVLLTERVDAGVLGGLRVSLGGRLLDGTIRGRLDDIRRKVSDVVV